MESVASSGSSANPLVSFCLFAYNQEPFIRDAIEGAFSQTYEPLEIILSDDCSSDRTFAIMEEMASAYRGPHTVILNRNERNRGLGAHVNRIVEISKGELLVAAAGDDISIPCRAETLCRAWTGTRPHPTSLYSAYEMIDVNGRVMGRSQSQDPRFPFVGYPENRVDAAIAYVRNEHPANGILGATHAWSRSLFRQAGPLVEEVSCEDRAICFRSLVAGSFAYIPDCLVRYRVHRNNIWSSTIEGGSRIEIHRRHLQRTAAHLAYWEAVLKGHEADINTYVKLGNLQERDGAVLRQEVERMLLLYRYEKGVYTAKPLAALACLARRLALRPDAAYAWSALKKWAFLTLDRWGLFSHH